MADTTNPDCPWLRRPQAAAYVREKHGQPCEKSALETYATRGGGPKFRKVGSAVLYHIGDLDEWANRRLSPAFKTTSEYRRAQPWHPAHDPQPQSHSGHALTRETIAWQRGRS
jgi:hypothetical protein